MVSTTTLLAAAAFFWAHAAPGVGPQHCPTGVAYGVKPASQMFNREAGVIAESVPGSCRITFRAGWRRVLTDRAACRTAAHEYGHAAIGLADSNRGIMQVSAAPGAWSPRVCRIFSNR